jgi:hypothetical protein
VAQSLQTRNQLPLDAGIALWKTYNERLIALHDRGAFPIVSFDEEPDTLEAKLRAAGEAMGLGSVPPGEPFFTDELRTAPAEGDSVPPDVEALYEDLRRRAL